MKELLESLCFKYQTKKFIKDDPIRFPHYFENGNKENVVIAGFIASIFAYGKREVFIKKLEELFKIMDFDPLNFVLNFKKYEYRLKGFNYRFFKDYDIIALFFILEELYNSKLTLCDLFYKNRSCCAKTMLQGVYNHIYNSKHKINSQGFAFMFPNPKSNSANKRANMFLRWMVRDGEVDFGIFDFIDKKELIIPLDVHCANVSRKLKLLKRKSNDYQAALELTEKLKEFDPNDPVKYDFALFGAGVNKNNLQVLVNM